MSLITTIPGVTFTDTTLPKLYRDTAITPGTQWAYDALDTYSWATQAAPSTGDLWKDMSPVGGDAVASNSALGFTAGFTKAAAGRFDCPVSGRVAAAADGLLFLLWLKYGTQPASGYSGIAGCYDTNVLNQYGFTVNNDASNGSIVAAANASSGTVMAVNPAAGTILQLGIALKKQPDLSYIGYFYKNGVLTSSVARAAPILQPTLVPRIGHTSTGAFGDTFVGTIYRALFDDTSTLASEAAITALVLKDYNANVDRFA